MKRTGFYLVVLVLVPWESRAEWSVFDPISETAPPQVDDAEWAGPVDALVYLRLKEAGLDPAPAVDRGVWMRRVTYDLVGVPPAAEDVQTLLDDARPDAEAMGDVVDRLLESPRYGERWARHWLDVVRYADTDGFAIDKERLWLWRYRDYVIRVLNEDRPFDQFIREQIAGDELDSGDGGKVAISYYRLGPWEADNMIGTRRQDSQRCHCQRRQHVPRFIRRLRPLSRPQVRSHPANGLLSAAGFFHSHPARGPFGRVSPQREECGCTTALRANGRRSGQPDQPNSLRIEEQDC